MSKDFKFKRPRMTLGFSARMFGVGILIGAGLELYVLSTGLMEKMREKQSAAVNEEWRWRHMWQLKEQGDKHVCSQLARVLPAPSPTE
ncbi:MAG: hypothetical protein MHM6MM_003352 [Cercozoa sp. M6MM]